MKNPLLSIVVPTKNRYKYLKYLISFFSTIQSNEIELIVQDNSDDNKDILDFMETIKDERVKYFYRPEHFTINKNSDYAILNSSGEYVCYMGDDDAFLPTILEAVELMKKYSAQAAIFSIPLYVWPDCKGTKWWDNYVPYKITKCSGKVTEFNSIEEFKAILSKGGYVLGNMPKVYHGITTRECLNKIYNEFGSFFPGPSPDMANAVALALQNIKIIKVDYPYLIGGTGQVRIVGNEKGDNQKSFKKLFFLDPDTEKYWDKRIPKIWTGQTIYPETILKTLEKAGHKEYEKYLNFYNFYIPFMKNHKQDAKMVFQLLSFAQYFTLGYYFVVFLTKLTTQKFKHKVQASPTLVIHEEIPDIIQYLNIVMEFNGKYERKI